jgi:drug/metabolite transporter (DMT)-like permease
MPYFMIRISVRELDPVTLVFARTAPAAVLLLIIAARSGALKNLRQHARWILAYTIVEFGIPGSSMGAAERHLSSSLTGLLVASVPTVTIIINKVLHPHDIIGPRRLIGLAVGPIGVAIVVGLDIGHSSPLWFLAMLAVVVGYSFGPTIVLVEVDRGVIAGSRGRFGGHRGRRLRPVGHLALARARERVGAVVLFGPRPPAHRDGFLCFFTLIRDIGPSRTVVVTYLSTAVAVALGTVFLHEPLTVSLLIGFPLIIGGSVLATFGEACRGELAQLAAQCGRGRQEFAANLSDVAITQGLVAAHQTQGEGERSRSSGRPAPS